MGVMLVLVLVIFVAGCATTVWGVATLARMMHG